MDPYCYTEFTYPSIKKTIQFKWYHKILFWLNSLCWHNYEVIKILKDYGDGNVKRLLKCSDCKKTKTEIYYWYP